MHGFFHQIFRFIYPHKDPRQLKRRYGLPETLNINVRISPDGWFVVTSPELPGLVTQAQDHHELLVMLNDAILTYFDVPKKEADVVYDRVTIGDKAIHYNASPMFF